MQKVLSRKSRDDLSDNELTFVKELLTDDLWRPSQAARKAGYKNPTKDAIRIMKKPAIAQALGKEQRRRLERLELKADEVLNMLATGLFFNPLALFKPSVKGGWVVEDLNKIPDEIGRLVEEVKVKTTQSMDDDGSITETTYFELKMISKTELLRMAMKHCGIDGTQKIEYSGNVDMEVHLSGGLNALLMNVEATRASQVIDAQVIESKIDV